jgi:hypothetical protein
MACTQILRGAENLAPNSLIGEDEANMNPVDKAVRKASKEKLLADMSWAAHTLTMYQDLKLPRIEAEFYSLAIGQGSTRFACLMTAFGS